MRLSKNQWTLRYEKNLLFLYIAAVISVMQQHNTCRRLHDRHSHKHLVRGGWGREFIFFRSIYGSFFPSFLQTLETMWAKRLPTHSNEKFHFLPSHICVISTRSPSCKVRPWGIDAPFNWLIAVETRNGKEHTFKNFSFIKQVQEFFFFFEGHDSLCYRCPSNRKYPLSPSLCFFMNRGLVTRVRDVTNGWVQSFIYSHQLMGHHQTPQTLTNLTNLKFSSLLHSIISSETFNLFFPDSGKKSRNRLCEYWSVPDRR